MPAASPALDAGAAEPARWWSPRAQFRRWWQARLPLTDTWVLGQRNIYILPTRAGLTFTLTLGVMLLAAINYQLNLGFALTFLIAGAGLVSMHLTHGNLRGLTLHLRPVARVHAGQPARLEIVITNPGRARHALAVRFESAPTAAGPAGRAAVAWCDVAAGGQETMHLSLVPTRRGWHAVPTLVAETVFPFGLFRAWTVWRPAGRLLAWPAPEQPAPPLPPPAPAHNGERPKRSHDGGEFDGVRPWRRGDTMRQVVWKKVARSNELVSRETAGTAQHELWLDGAATGAAEPELRLARLTAWLLAAQREALPCGMRLGGREWPPVRSRAELDAVLDDLATWP